MLCIDIENKTICFFLPLIHWSISIPRQELFKYSRHPLYKPIRESLEDTSEMSLFQSGGKSLDDPKPILISVLANPCAIEFCLSARCVTMNKSCILCGAQIRNTFLFWNSFNSGPISYEYTTIK